MSEEKMIIPAYVRIGVCKECGAHVYAPEGGGMPFMSSCPCAAAERKVVSAAEGVKRKPQREVARKTDEKGKAA
jgi:hypothetical protein